MHLYKFKARIPAATPIVFRHPSILAAAPTIVIRPKAELVVVTDFPIAVVVGASIAVVVRGKGGKFWRVPSEYISVPRYTLPCEYSVVKFPPVKSMHANNSWLPRRR
jgi:hypothetical protein